MVSPAEPTYANLKDPILNVHRLHVAFGRQQVLRDVNLVVPRGQTVAVIGESGCGKTVLLKAMVGLIQPARGEIYFDSHNLEKLNDRQLAKQRSRFGFLFQSAALFDSLTVGHNVAFPLLLAGTYSEAQIKNIVSSRLAQVGLPDAVMTQKPAELSGGMRKRVGLARALAINPEVMLYDEPTTGLDPIVSDVINELIIRTKGIYPVTSIVVTHDMRTAAKVADRIVMIFPLSRLADEEPQVIFDGTPTELEKSTDRRVTQFVRGEAGERLMEMRERTHEL